MKKILSILFIGLLIFTLCGCGCDKDGKGKDKDIPEPTPGKEENPSKHFDYQEVMFDNPSDWPTDTFFINVPAVAAQVDDLTHVIHGDNAEKEVYTLTIKEMPYETYREYTDKLNSAGFSCSRASYWIPDTEDGLTNNYSQCEANSAGVYIKANWYKSSVNSFNFQMTITNYEMSAS